MAYARKRNKEIQETIKKLCPTEKECQSAKSVNAIFKNSLFPWGNEKEQVRGEKEQANGWMMGDKEQVEN